MTVLKCIALLVISVILVASVAAHGDHHRHHDHDEGADHHEHHKCSHSHSSHDHHHHDNEVHEDHDTHSLSDESHSHSHSHPAVVTSHDDRSSPLASALIDGTIGSLFTSVVPIAVIPIVALVSGPGIGGGAQRAHTRLVVLTSIAAGAIIADSLSHYPSSAGEEGHHHHDHDHDHHTGSGHTSGGGVKEVFGLALSAWYVLGFVSFFVVDGCSFGAGGCHDHSDGAAQHTHGGEKDKKKKTTTTREASNAVKEVSGSSSSRAFLSLTADFVHNVTDGAVLGISALASPASLYRRTASLIAHELPHEVGDYAVLSQCGWSLKSILISQLVTGLGSWIGCVSVIALKFVWANNFGVETSDQLLEALEAFVGGSFLYLGTVVLIADLNRQLATRSILLKAVAAVAFYGGVQALEVAHLLESAFV